jgi:hypothetical protein
MSDRPWEEAYEEAKKRGEVINFGSDKDAAIKFGQGSWKDKKQMGGSVYPVNYIPQAQNGFDAKAFQKTLDDKFAKDKQSRSKKSSNVKLKDTRNAVVDETSTKPVVNEKLFLKELKQVNDNQQKIEDAKDYYKQYLNSPKARERISNMIDYRSDPEYDRLFPEEKNSVVDQEIKNRLEGLNKLKGKFDYIDDVGTYSSSYYEPKTNSLFVRPNSDANISFVNGDENEWNNKIDVSNTIGHEIGHAIGRHSNKDSNNIWYSNGISKKESDLLMNANIGLMRSKNRDEVLKDRNNPEYTYDLDHDNRPSELKADIDALRYQLYRQGVYDPGTQDFTREHLEKAKPSFTRNRLNEHFNDDELIDLMNKLSYNETNDDGITPIAQMGGSIPGAVGFSYARTQGAAPSNGKYAKKTMASAQNGSWLSKYDVAQEGIKKFKLKDERLQAIKPSESTNLKKKNFELEQAKEYKTYVNQLAEQQKENKRRKSLTKDQREREDYNARNEERGSIQATVPESKWDRTKAIVSNPLTAFGYAARNESLPTRFQHGERNTFDNAIDWINPLQGVAALSEIPGELGRGEYLNAGLSALDAVDLGVYVKGAKKLGSNQLRNLSPAIGYREGGTIAEYPEAQFGALLKKGVKAVGNEAKFVKKAIETSAKDYHSLLKDLPKAKSLKEVAGRFAGLPIEGSLPRLSPQELKIFRQVQEIGRLRATGKPISKQYQYALEQGLPEEHLKKVFGKTKAEIENAIPNAQEQEAFRLANPITDRINLQRPPRRTSSSDAAIDQMNASAVAPLGSDQDIQNIRAMFDHLSSAPVRQNNLSMFRLDPDQLAHFNSPHSSGSFNYGPGKVENFVRETLSPLESVHDKASSKFINAVQDYPYHQGPVMENVPSLSLSGSGSLKNVSDKVSNAGNVGMKSGDIYTGSLNTSHSSYLPQLKQVFKSTEGAPQFFGYKPMNSMGFLSDYHYSKDDIAKYLNTEIDEQIKRGIIPGNVQRPFVKGENVQLPHYGIKQFRGGGIIKDDRGQWDHPGEITEIDSNDITMEGVPYDVLGISDTGDIKMMKPGKNYKFKGKKVTEYPMAKNGLRQEQKGLQNLDNLTNFTNYNTKQPGGWLDTL